MRIHPSILVGLGLAAAAAAAVPVLGQDGPLLRTRVAPGDPWIELRRARAQGSDPLARGEGADLPAPSAARTTPAATVEEPEGDPRNPRVAREPPATVAEGLETASTNPPRPRPAEEDPFAALGLRAGSFLVFPAVETAAGYTTNATGVAGGAGSPFLAVRPELSVQSDWALHAFRLDFRGSYQAFTGGATPDRPTATARAALRLDLPARWQADIAAGYELRNEGLTDPALPAGADVPPQAHILAAEAALGRTVGPLLVEAGGEVARATYSDAIAGGVAVDQSERDNLAFTGRLRLGSDHRRILRPYVEGIAGRRLYDVAVDAAGNPRAATISELRGGIAYDSAPVLTADLAAGYRWEDPDAPGVPALRGFTIEGNAAWSPRRLITIALTAATTFNPSTTVGGGSIAREVALDAAYALRPDLTLNARAGFRGERFAGIGTDRTISVGAAATWKASRTLWLTARYSHEWLLSYDPGRNAQSDTFELGARLQR